MPPLSALSVARCQFPPVDQKPFSAVRGVLLGARTMNKGERTAGDAKGLLPMFLNSQQLQDMTGYHHHASQVKWLTKYGFSFDIRRDGRPNVLIDQIRERQCKNFERTPGPDLSWMD